MPSLSACLRRLILMQMGHQKQYSCSRMLLLKVTSHNDERKSFKPVQVLIRGQLVIRKADPIKES